MRLFLIFLFYYSFSAYNMSVIQASNTCLIVQQIADFPNSTNESQKNTYNSTIKQLAIDLTSRLQYNPYFTPLNQWKSRLTSDPTNKSLIRGGRSIDDSPAELPTKPDFILTFSLSSPTQMEFRIYSLQRNPNATSGFTVVLSDMNTRHYPLSTAAMLSASLLNEVTNFINKTNRKDIYLATPVVLHGSRSPAIVQHRDRLIEHLNNDQQLIPVCHFERWDAPELEASKYTIDATYSEYPEQPTNLKLTITVEIAFNNKHSELLKPTPIAYRDIISTLVPQLEPKILEYLNKNP